MEKERILRATEGNYLYNAEAHSIVKVVSLGKEADASRWVEITEEKREMILTEQYKAMEEDANNGI